jgi:hypothetical protein
VGEMAERTGEGVLVGTEHVGRGRHLCGRGRGHGERAYWRLEEGGGDKWGPQDSGTGALSQQREEVPTGGTR